MTLRSGQLPRRMVAEAVVLVLVQQRLPLAVPVAVKEPKEEQQHHLDRMGAVAVVVPAVHLVSVLSGVGAVVVDVLHQPYQMAGHTHVMAELVAAVVAV